MKDFINILNHSREELELIFANAVRLKKRKKAGVRDLLFMGKVLGMYFEKASLRTRVSLDVAATSLGGSAILLETGGVPLGTREALKDQALVMSRYVDAISIRTFGQDVVETFAEYSTVPVINVLSDFSHPTQAMADIMTLREHVGDLGGKTLAFVGDGNNVARSLASLCVITGMNFVLACPKGYELSDDFVSDAMAKSQGGTITQTNDVAEAVSSACGIYTDVWASMGQEDETEKRKKEFQAYQINGDLMQKAPDGALVLHCLPAHRGDEITDEVIDSSASIVYDQAENRMHINRSLLVTLEPVM